MMHGSTLPFAPTKTYNPVSVNLRDKWNLFFFSLSLMFVCPSLFFLFPHLFSYPPDLPFFCLFSFSFLFNFPLSIFSSLFLPFLFSISLFYYHQPMVQKWGKLPPTFLNCLLSSSQIFLIFSLFSFPSFSST